MDAVASMLYLDYSGTTVSGTQPVRRPGEPRGHRFPAGGQCHGLPAQPGIVMIAEESTSFPGVTKPTSAAGWASASSGTWAGCTTASSTWPRTRSTGTTTTTRPRSPWLTCSQNFPPLISHDAGCLRQGAPCSARRRVTGGSSWPTCARVPRIHVGAPQAADLHGHGSTPRSRSGRREHGWTGGSPRPRRTTVSRNWSSP
ncbi:hypothetical protein QJS66_09425 [Kocuria rhizophila]|nr:hypothetical protein QJS66_09425 [Kocuria rhizophila]